MAPDENLFENDERAKGDLHDCILKKFSPFLQLKTWRGNLLIHTFQFHKN